MNHENRERERRLIPLGFTIHVGLDDELAFGGGWAAIFFSSPRRTLTTASSSRRADVEPSGSKVLRCSLHQRPPGLILNLGSGNCDFQKKQFDETESSWLSLHEHMMNES